MGIANLRRADGQETHGESSLSEMSTTDFSIESISISPVRQLLDPYPFDQHRHHGKVLYKEQSKYTPGREIEIDFEYRDGSNLFITEYGTDISSQQSVLRDVAEAVPQIRTVYRNIHAPEDALWDFLEAADRILEITVLDGGKETPYKEVDETPVEHVVGNYSIENAVVGFNRSGHQIVVKYRHGSIQIETDWEEGREFIIQLFEREVLAGSDY